MFEIKNIFVFKTKKLSFQLALERYQLISDALI